MSVSPVSPTFTRILRVVIACVYVSIALSITGCGPTYPKEKFNESIIRVCRQEYKLDVKVDTIGKTIAIYVPLENVIDFTFSVTKSASEKINDVILSVSRVALSSDARFDFYCVIAHDIRIPEIQIVIIKSVEDVKRFLLNDISRNEYSKRMIVDIRLSPQAQKERAIKEVFEKMSLDKRWQEEVMNDFFRSQPAGMGDIGYWGDHFYIKDILPSEFLSEQMASRIRLEFRDDKAFAEAFLLKASKCLYVARGKERLFKADVFIENRFYGKPGAEEGTGQVASLALKIMAHVLHTYHFAEFDYVLVGAHQGEGYMKVSREALERYRLKKVKLSEIMEKVDDVVVEPLSQVPAL